MNKYHNVLLIDAKMQGNPLHVFHALHQLSAGIYSIKKHAEANRCKGVVTCFYVLLIQAVINRCKDALYNSNTCMHLLNNLHVLTE